MTGRPSLDLSGRSVKMTRTGLEVIIGRRLDEGGQGVVHEATLGANLVAVKWLRPGVHNAELRRCVDALAARPSPHPAFAWPIDLVESDELPSFGYVMPLLGSGFVSFAAMIREEVQPPFRVIISIARELVDAFASLHATGLCYRDISFGNLRVDPERAEVTIIDNDNVGVDDDCIFVRGTLRFMAPEIVRGDALPKTVTDLFSIAVFLFHLFVHGHPLEGSRTDSSFNWSGDFISESELALRHYGREPLFVFDPGDDSNRPSPGDPMLRWWPIYPRFFRELFEHMFTTGLVDASLSGRFPEGVWRRALSRLADCISACPNCGMSMFWDPNDPRMACWNCRTVPPAPPRLAIAGHHVVLVEGAAVTGHHLTRSYPGHREILAEVEPHPTKGSGVVLRNLSDETWTVVPDGETTKSVGPGKRLGIRPMTIDFGAVSGQIVVADG